MFRLIAVAMPVAEIIKSWSTKNKGCCRDYLLNLFRKEKTNRATVSDFAGLLLGVGV